jgi:hypothetical protein
LIKAANKAKTDAETKATTAENDVVKLKEELKNVPKVD